MLDAGETKKADAEGHCAGLSLLVAGLLVDGEPGGRRSGEIAIHPSVHAKMPRHIEVLAFPDCQLLDVAGPHQVFASA